MLRYCEKLKAIRYESMNLNRIVADKSHRVIVALESSLFSLNVKLLKIQDTVLVLMWISNVSVNSKSYHRPRPGNGSNFQNLSNHGHPGNQ